MWDPEFSESSFGFRPRRNAHGAVKQVHGFIREGYRWAVDIDLSKFLETSSYYTPSVEAESKRLGWLSMSLMRSPLRLPWVT